jgi:hypothetical protein
MVRHSRLYLIYLLPFNETRPINAIYSSRDLNDREIESSALADGKDRWGLCVAVAYETE